MNSNIDYLIRKIELKIPLFGFYDAPDPDEFKPIVTAPERGHACVYAFYRKWLEGTVLCLSKSSFGCGGASHHLFNQATRSHEEFIRFLVDDEGLKSDHTKMNEWLGTLTPYTPENPYIFIGPLRPGMESYLKTVTFLVNPDQLSMLMIGAQYFASLSDPEPVIAPFGSGCMQMVTGFRDLKRPQAMIGATDMAMRKYLPPELMAFTVTVPMVENLCRIGKNSFLEKNFIQDLKKSRQKVK